MKKIDPFIVHVGDITVTYDTTGIIFSRYGNSSKANNHVYYNFSDSTVIVRQNGIITELIL